MQLRAERYFSDKSLPFHIQIGASPESFPAHGHDFTELVIVLMGTGTHVLNQEQARLAAGDVYVLRGDMRHSIEQPEGLTICNIKFDESHFFSATDDLNRIPGFNALFDTPARRGAKGGPDMRLHVEQLKYVRHLLDELEIEFTVRQAGFRTRIRAIFLNLIVLLARACEGSQQANEKQLQRISEAIAFMENNYLRIIRLEEIAAKAFLSPAHFCRVFKSMYQVSPLDYVKKLRLWHACQLIKSRAAPIKEIAYACGFSDHNYFSRCFKKEMGYTPAEFARLNGEGMRG